MLGSFDLSRALQTGGANSGGTTIFNELTGQGVYDKGTVQITNASVSAGAMNAGMSLNIDANGRAGGPRGGRREDPEPDGARDAQYFGQSAGSRDQEVTAPTVLRFRGARALSDFRLAKLLQELKVVQAAVRGVTAEFWHFVEADAEPGAEERKLLERLLRYGTPLQGYPAGERFLVVPRLGTISPWSSKATDIARNCGLDGLRRIERGILFFVESKEKTNRERIGALLHDRMTESVLGSLDEAEGMFRHVARGRWGGYRWRSSSRPTHASAWR